MKDYQFEVCANSVESCIAAQAGGADRVELCAGIPEGGTTPSYGDILIAREVLQQTKLHIIVRPRGGDFLYSSTEQRIMLKDIENARRLGADGVVFGCLTAEGDVDIPLMEQLMKASQGMSVTFHRAFDVCRNPQKAIEDIIALGCNRILTSGQQPTAERGIPLLKELQQQASDRIILLAGCGVNETNIAHIARETGIREFHFSARENIESSMLYHNSAVSMGGTVHIDEYTHTITTAERVKRTIGALKASPQPLPRREGDRDSPTKYKHFKTPLPTGGGVGGEAYKKRMYFSAHPFLYHRINIISSPEKSILHSDHPESHG